MALSNYVLMSNMVEYGVSSTIPSGISLYKVFTNNVFFQIIISNLSVLFVIIYGGFFTGGLITIIILIWNTFITYLSVIQGGYKYSIHELFLNFMYHGIFELASYLVAANISYRGFSFYRGILIHDKMNFKLLPTRNEVFFLIALLLIAAIIETNTINQLFFKLK
jgi:uncharacterized membrane protein SpoIIM required for sporulation